MRHFGTDPDFDSIYLLVFPLLVHQAALTRFDRHFSDSINMVSTGFFIDNERRATYRSQLSRHSFGLVHVLYCGEHSGVSEFLRLELPLLRFGPSLQAFDAFFIWYIFAFVRFCYWSIYPFCSCLLLQLGPRPDRSFWDMVLKNIFLPWTWTTCVFFGSWNVFDNALFIFLAQGGLHVLGSSHP